MTSGPSAPDPIYTLRGTADTVTALKVGIINYQSLHNDFIFAHVVSHDARNCIQTIYKLNVHMCYFLNIWPFLKSVLI